MIIIENGSSDCTYQLINNSYNDNRIKLYQLDAACLVTSLNYGLEKSVGKYIARMDHDDISHHLRLQKQVDFLNKNPETGVVATLVKFHSLTSKGLGLSEYVDWQNSLISWHEIFHNRFVESPIVHPSTMIRRSVLEAFDSWSQGNFPEDYELWLRLISNGVKIAKIPEELLVWIDSDERLTRKDSRYSIDAFYQMKTRYLSSWIQQELESRELYIWGAGKKSSKRALILENFGTEIKGFIDIDSKKIGKEISKKPIISYKKIPELKSPFILSYVGNRGAGKEVFEHLTKKGLIEGIDFLMVS